MLRGRPAGVSANPSGANRWSFWEKPMTYRLWYFTMTAAHDDHRIGGNNVQLVVGAADMPREGRNVDVALWLRSGWWVSLRNQFADRPRAAVQIISSVADELSALTAKATQARGEQASELASEIEDVVLKAVGPEEWA